MLCRDVINVGQSDQLVDRQLVFFAFQAVKPAGRDLVSLIAPFLGKAKTAFLNLSQRELPLPANRTEPCTNPCHERTFPVLPLSCKRKSFIATRRFFRLLGSGCSAFLVLGSLNTRSPTRLQKVYSLLSPQLFPQDAGDALKRSIAERARPTSAATFLRGGPQEFPSRLKSMCPTVSHGVAIRGPGQAVTQVRV